jgi:hypothetical protein
MRPIPPIRPAAPAKDRRRRLLPVAGPWWLVVGIVLLMALPAAAVQPPTEEASDEVFAWRLTHRRAQELFPLVESLLSPNGTMELHNPWNLVVFRDDPETLERIRAFVTEFDRPPRRLSVDIVIMQSGKDQSGKDQGGDSEDDAPSWLAKGVGKVLNFPSYRTFGRARIGLLEGQNVEYTIGGRYGVRFEAGNVRPNGRLRLRQFEILSGPSHDRRIFAADLGVHLDKPYVLAFARDEQTGVEMAVALLCRWEEVRRGAGGGS